GMVLPVERGAGGVDRDAGPEAREEIHPIILAVGPRVPSEHWPPQRDWNVDLGFRAEGGAVKTSRRDTDDGERLPVYDQTLVQDIRIGREARGPVRVTEHGDGRFTDEPIVS